MYSYNSILTFLYNLDYKRLCLFSICVTNQVIRTIVNEGIACCAERLSKYETYLVRSTEFVCLNKAFDAIKVFCVANHAVVL